MRNEGKNSAVLNSFFLAAKHEPAYNKVKYIPMVIACFFMV
ncbi:hypothetical protein [Clostridium oryzae]|nr:hypothetical protein [Clostridium oryzae]